MKYVDLETDLSHRGIWCYAYALDETEEPRLAVTEAHPRYLETVEVGDWCAHNAIGFERHRFKGIGWTQAPCPIKWTDTLVMSRLYDPSMEGGHSLAAWGQRLGLPKGEIELEQFDIGYTEEMGEYCKQDVRVLQKLHPHLVRLLDEGGFSQQSIDLEHTVAAITDDMTRRGFPFDVELANKTLMDNIHRRNEITRELQQRWPPSGWQKRVSGSLSLLRLVVPRLTRPHWKRSITRLLR